MNTQSFSKNILFLISLSMGLIASSWIAPRAQAGVTEGEKAAMNIVNEAISFAKTSGRPAVIAEVNKGTYKKGELYVTIYDMSGVVLAHPTKPIMIGKNMSSQKDADGKEFVKERMEMLKAKEDGWQTYKFENPVAHKIEEKKTYLKKFDGMIFGAGVYQ